MTEQTLLEKHLPMVQKVAWSFVKRFPMLEFDDAMSVACLACLEAEAKYDPSRGRETTFVWTVVRNALHNYVVKESRIAQYTTLDDLEVKITGHTPSPEEQVIAEEEWRCIVSRLSDDAKVVLNIVLSNKPYLPTHSPRESQARLRKILSWRGWTSAQIDRAFQEIRLSLQ